MNRFELLKLVKRIKEEVIEEDENEFRQYHHVCYCGGFEKTHDGHSGNKTEKCHGCGKEIVGGLKSRNKKSAVRNQLRAEQRQKLKSILGEL